MDRSGRGYPATMTTDPTDPTGTGLTAVLRSHPGEHDVDLTVLTDAVEALTECAAACRACADACLDEEMVAELVACIRTDLTCADVCSTTAAVLVRRPTDPSLVRSLVEACAAACGACATECERHAGMHEHCRACAETCRRCERACRDLLAALG